MNKVFIKDIVSEFIVGDWGSDSVSPETPNLVLCIRGADINDINKNSYFNLPRRYINNHSKKTKILKVGDIIIEKSGGSPTQSTGRCGYVSDIIIKAGDIVCSNFCVGVRVKEEYNSEYVYYYLKYIYKQGVFFKYEGKTTGIKNLNIEGAFKSIPFINGSKKSQQCIASVLSNIDNKISLNNQTCANLSAVVKLVYDYWFMQFDFPNIIDHPYKSTGGKMVFDKRLNRDIPEGWRVEKIGDCLNTYLGGTPSTTNSTFWENGSISWLNSGEVANFPIVSSEQKITKEAVKGSATNLMKKGSVLLSITRHLRATILGVDACINQSIVGIEESEILKKSFIYPFLENDIPRLMKLRTGAQQPHINKDIVDRSWIIIPPDHILESYYEIVDNFYDQIISLAIQNKELAELRDWLLPLLMNGQVTINNQEEVTTKKQPVQAHEAFIITPHILGGHIVNKLQGSRGMGQTKLQKALHLAEYHCRLPLNTIYYKNTAGPHSQEMLNEIRQKFNQYQHVKVTEDTVNGKPHYTFTPTAKITELEQAYSRIESTTREKIDNMLDKLAKMDLGGAEILSTLYAVWNNRLIRKEPVTDDLLVADFYAWSDHKSDFPESRVRNCLDYMRTHDIIPTGWGLYIDKKSDN